jgi:hypothetical protein
MTSTSRLSKSVVGGMPLKLTDEETFALLNLLVETIKADKLPLSPRVQILRAILAKFGPMAPAPPPPARPPTPKERDPRIYGKIIRCGVSKA